MSRPPLSGCRDSQSIEANHHPWVVQDLEGWRSDDALSSRRRQAPVHPEFLGRFSLRWMLSRASSYRSSDVTWPGSNGIVKTPRPTEPTDQRDQAWIWQGAHPGEPRPQGFLYDDPLSQSLLCTNQLHTGNGDSRFLRTGAVAAAPGSRAAAPTWNRTSVQDSSARARVVRH